MQKHNLKGHAKRTVAWRASPEVRKLLDQAQHVTRLKVKEIVEACIEVGHEGVINKIVDKKMEEAKRADEARNQYFRSKGGLSRV